MHVIYFFTYAMISGPFLEHKLVPISSGFWLSERERDNKSTETIIMMPFILERMIISETDKVPE